MLLENAAGRGMQSRYTLFIEVIYKHYTLYLVGELACFITHLYAHYTHLISNTG